MLGPGGGVGLSVQREPGYVIFVDEAGDPGIKSVGPGAASEWFTMGAMVIEQSRDPETVQWVREIKTGVGQIQKPFFHYKDVPQGDRRALACELLAAKPCRLFAVASHKPNMSGYQNPRAETQRGQFVFYNWVLRVLLERVTRWVRARSLADHGEVRKARLVLSATGGLNYNQLIAYHELLRAQGKNAYLGANTIAWDVLSHTMYEPVPARTNAGVQLADIVASAIYQAANVDGSYWNIEPALSLRPRMALGSGGLAANCGLTLMPLRRSDQRLDQPRRKIFEAYGYRF